MISPLIDGIIINKRLNQHQIAQSARASEIVFKANQHINKWLKCETDEARAMTLKDGVLWVGTAVRIICTGNA